MPSSGPDSPDRLMKHACVSCARRKIRCDRRQPCANCAAQAQLIGRRRGRPRQSAGHERSGSAECVYVEPAPTQRHRRRQIRSAATALGDDLLARLQLYEELLRKNGIAVSEPLDSLEQGDRLWIASPWEAKVPRHPPPPPPAPTPSSADTVVAEEPPMKTAREAGAAEGDYADAELEMWLALPNELRNPSVSAIFRRPFGQKDAGRPDSALPADTDETWLAALRSSEPVRHPEPRVILRLWQAFVDNVNPLMRIVHVPTTHQTIVNASWDADHAPPSVSALLFAIYALAITSMSPAEYAEVLGGPSAPAPAQAELLGRFRAGAARALMAAGVLTTRQLDVLQAFALFVMTEPNADRSGVLAAMAVHLGRRMGLDRDASRSACASCSGVSFFEQEMRVRLWWQIRRLDERVQQAVNLSFSNMMCSLGEEGHGHHHHHHHHHWGPPTDLNQLRLPLNINDADLHPDMVEAPVAHSGPTEMMYVLMKYETAVWMQAFAKGDLSAAQDRSRPASPLALARLKDAAVDQLEALFAARYLHRCDVHIPLHAITASMGHIAVAHLRFQAWHPRVTMAGFGGREDKEEREVHFTRENADAAFAHGLRMLELCFASRSVARMGTSFVALHLLADVVMQRLIDAAVYVVSMLRVRTTGADVDRAWAMVATFYDMYGPDLEAAAAAAVEAVPASAPDETRRRRAAGAAFVTAFWDLTRAAWAAREAAAAPVSLDTPAFVLDLESRQRVPAAAAMGGGDDTLDVDTSMLLPQWAMPFPNEPALDWEYWTEFMQM